MTASTGDTGGNAPPVADPLDANAAEWETIRALFARCLESSPAECAVLLGDDASVPARVRAAVEALIRASDRATLLDRGLDAWSSALVDDEPLPEIIGPYRPLRCIGRGGMGTVYLAQRNEAGLQQQVALKQIRLGLDTPVLRARMKRERAILARLSHDRIARLLDGGIDESGRPWFALEFVDGEPITRWADAHRIDIRARARLFLDVLEAVAYAHRNLVVHRDIKPGNVLVNADGHVKLLDFGIAKLVEGDDEATLTAADMAPMTPAYAAPEQISGEPIGTATEIYALGVLLYELLVGRLPYRVDPQQRQRYGAAVMHDEPERLARALRRTDARPAAADISAARGERVPVLARALERDLDQIVRKALQKNPEHRYATADAFAADIRAWLEHRPLLGSAVAWRHRVAKFLRRHRVAVATAVIVLATAFVGAATTLWQAREAQRQAGLANRVRAFLTGMLEDATPERALGRQLTVRDALDHASAKLDKELVGDEAMQALLRSDVGQIYLQIGAYDDAEKHLRRAVALADATPRLSRIERGVTRRRLAYMLYEAGKAAEALPIAEQATVELVNANAPLTYIVDALNVRTLLRSDTGDETGAMASAQESLRIVDTDPASNDDMRADVYDILAMRYERAGDFPTAVEWHRKSIAKSEGLYGKDDPAVLTGWQNLAVAMGQNGGDFAEVEGMFRHVLEGRRRTLGESHPHTIHVQRELAWNLATQGRLPEALALFDTVVSAVSRDGERDDLAFALNGRGRARLFGDDVSGAIEDFEAAAAIWADVRGKDDEYTLSVITWLAVARLRNGERERAFELADAATRQRESTSSKRISPSYLARGLAHLSLGRADPARADFERAIETVPGQREGDPAALAPIQIELAAALRVLGRPDAAVAELDAAERGLAKRFRTVTPRQIRLDEERAALAVARGDDAAAEKHARAARELRARFCLRCPPSAPQPADVSAATPEKSGGT